MKQYVIDQLREDDYDKIREYLDTHAEKTMLEELYWVDLPESLYAPVQQEHKDCRPFYFAVNLTKRQVAFEWLIRSRQILRCACVAYATPEQRGYIIGYGDKMLEELELKL